MHRSVALAGALVISLAGASRASAQDVVPEEQVETEELVPQPDPQDTQEIGGVVGIALGGGVSPGGVAVEGRYLYRLSDLDWLESGVSFNLGSGAAECFRDRSSEFVCDHGLVDGFAAEGSVAVRRYLSGQKAFRPFVRLGVGLRLVSFAGDDVLGVATPVLLGGGVRAEVANRVLVVVDATFRAGPAFLNQNLGLEPNAGLSMGAGVEFTLE